MGRVLPSRSNKSCSRENKKMAEQDWLGGTDSRIEPMAGAMAGRLQPAVRHELRPLTTGEILDRTFFLYRSNFWLYVGLASIAAGASVLASIGKLAYIRLSTTMQSSSPKAIVWTSVITV